MSPKTGCSDAGATRTQPTSTRSVATRDHRASPTNHRGHLDDEVRPASSQDDFTDILPRDFPTFISSVRQDMMPRSALEAILVERLAVCAWRLHQFATPVVSEAVEASSALINRDERRAERSLERTLSALERLRALDRLPWGRATPEPSRSVVDLDEIPWPAAEASCAVETPEAESGSDVHPLWRERLTCDPEVSETSPVVRGTWVTVSHVVSLIVDGWSWADILRSHPELTESDIRACLAYSIEEENASLII